MHSRKVIIGKTFYGACRYACMDSKRAVLLEAEGVRDYDLLLQTIVEKLESLEIAFLKESDSSKDEAFQKQVLQTSNLWDLNFKRSFLN